MKPRPPTIEEDVLRTSIAFLSESLSTGYGSGRSFSKIIALMVG